jgi:hypothetical protein
MAMLIGLHRDALYVHPRGRRILVIERFLGLKKAAGLFGDHPRLGMPRLVQMETFNSRAGMAAASTWRSSASGTSGR